MTWAPRTATAVAVLAAKVPGTDTRAGTPDAVVPNGMRRKLFSAVAAQLGRPHGRASRLVALALNRGNRAAISAAVELSGAAPGDVSADVGFGGGLGLLMLLDRVGDDGVVHGIEISPAMLDRARARHVGNRASGRLRLARGSLTALPLPDRCLDGAITVNTLYFVSDLDQASVELARVVRPGGRLVVGIGDPDAMARLPFTPYGFILRPVDSVVSAFERAGFALQEHQTLEKVAIRHHLIVLTRVSDVRE